MGNLNNILKKAFSALPISTQEKAKGIIERRVLAGGDLVSEAQYTARITICRTRLAGQPCEFLGLVFPGGVEFKEGCQVCGCPLATKARMASITDPIMSQIFQGGDPEIICKHPDGNFWEKADNHFKSKKK